MTLVHDQFKGKRVTVMELGVLGRGVGDAEYLAQQGALVTVTDMKSETQLTPLIERLKKYNNIKFVFGGHNTEDFTTADVIIKAAGVPINSPYIDAAKEANIPIYMSTALAAYEARKAGATIVGVTGTRGKSTVAHMIYEVLHQTGRRAHLAGSARLTSTLAQVPHYKDGDVVVFELDSWQLQGFGDLRFSPDIAVFTNLMLDHQHYYPTITEYFEDKACIFRFQRESDVLIVGTDIEKQIVASHPPVLPIVPKPLDEHISLTVPGQHNRENAALAYETLRALQVPEQKIASELSQFQGLEGRLQYLEEKRGVKVYNDSTATTPEATIAAVNALREVRGHIVIIVGGTDKTSTYGDFSRAILDTCVGVILLKGTNIDKLKLLLPNARIAETLQDAVNVAFQIAKKGDAILFSPGCPPFGMYKNEFERDAAFIKLINERPD
jgi:UDP-N-acetylmuramoylalanine--D-glutamate ligase